MELKTIIPRAIQTAREHGDLRENAEYSSALERQEFVRARLSQLTRRQSELSGIDLGVTERQIAESRCDAAPRGSSIATRAKPRASVLNSVASPCTARPRGEPTGRRAGALAGRRRYARSLGLRP